MVGDELSMPTQNRVGLDEKDRPAVTTNDPRQRTQERAIFGLETRTGDLALQDHELVTEYEDLDILGTLASTA